MKEYLRLALTLGVLGVICAGVLSFVNALTAPIIAENTKEESYAIYYDIYEQANEEVDDFVEIDSNKVSEIQNNYPGVQEVLQAQNDGQIVGYVFNVAANGYGGEMVNSIIFDLEGNIVGYRNISHGETPGFGADIANEPYYSQFTGKSIAGGQQLEIGSSGENQVEGISGATVTTNAVMESLNEAVSAYQEYFMGQ